MGDNVPTDIRTWEFPGAVAHRFAVSQRTVWRWLRRGTLRGAKINGQWRISRESVDALLEKIRKGTT